MAFFIHAFVSGFCDDFSLLLRSLCICRWRAFSSSKLCSLRDFLNILPFIIHELNFPQSLGSFIPSSVAIRRMELFHFFLAISSANNVAVSKGSPRVCSPCAGDSIPRCVWCRAYLSPQGGVPQYYSCGIP